MNAAIPSFLKQTGPAAFTLTLSASAAETFMLCPAKYSWSRLTGIEGASPRAGINYGKGMHLLLAALYRHEPFDAATLLGEHFAANPQPEMGARGNAEWRTQARALQAFTAYRERYASEHWEALGVEEPFEVTLGGFDAAADGATITVSVRGIRDLRVRWHDSLWVVDHKTSTEWSDLTADEGKASFQFMGYAWVERLLARQGNADQASRLPVGGVIGNYLIARQPYSEGYKVNARSLPRDQFERVSYPFSDAQLDEWRDRAMTLAQGIWRSWSASEWPQHSTACAHWGRCEYYQLCWETDPAYRASAALGADFRPRTLSPLDELET